MRQMYIRRVLPFFGISFFLSSKLCTIKKSSKSQPTTSTCVVSWNLLCEHVGTILGRRMNLIYPHFLIHEPVKMLNFIWLTTEYWLVQFHEFHIKVKTSRVDGLWSIESAVYIVWISRIIIGIVYVRGGGWNYKVEFAYHKNMQCTALRGPLHSSHMPMAYGTDLLVPCHIIYST